MKHNYQVLFFTQYDFDGIAQFLERKATQGWELDYIGQFVWRFKKAPPRQRHYAISYLASRNGYQESVAEYRDYCAAAGWNLAAYSEELMVFYNDAENPVPLETDPHLQIENLDRIMQSKYLPYFRMLVGLALVLCLLLLVQPLWLHRPISLRDLAAIGCMGVLSALLIVDMVVYRNWHRKALEVAQGGILLPSPRILDFQFPLLLTGALFYLVHFFLSDTDAQIQSLSFLFVLYLVQEVRRKSSFKPES